MICENGKISWSRVTEIAEVWKTVMNFVSFHQLVQSLHHYYLLQSSENLSLIVWDMCLHSEVWGFVILTLWSPFPVHGPMPSILVEGPFSSVQLVQFSDSVVSNCATPWTAAYEASLSLTNSRSLLKLMSIESVMPSNSLILCHPLSAPLAKNCPNCQLFFTMNYLHQV